VLTEDLRQGALWLTLDRPERLNAFTADSYRALREALDRAGADPEVRVVVLTGRGRAFSAGADRSLVDGTSSSAQRREAAAELDGLLDSLGRCERPVLAAVNGLAVGVGCTLLLHCDLVVLAESARLRLPFTALGIPPEAGSSYLLPALTTRAEATWALLSSEWIDAGTALAMGLVWRVVADGAVESEVDRAVEVLSSLDPAAVAMTKALIVAGREDAVRAARRREATAARQRFSLDT
jgi:enoyl-CoA hydratase/carnithine racemase